MDTSLTVMRTDNGSNSKSIPDLDYIRFTAEEKPEHPGDTAVKAGLINCSHFRRKIQHDFREEFLKAYKVEQESSKTVKERIGAFCIHLRRIWVSLLPFLSKSLTSAERWM